MIDKCQIIISFTFKNCGFEILCIDRQKLDKQLNILQIWSGTLKSSLYNTFSLCLHNA